MVWCWYGGFMTYVSMLVGSILVLSVACAHMCPWAMLRPATERERERETPTRSGCEITTWPAASMLASALSSSLSAHRMRSGRPPIVIVACACSLRAAPRLTAQLGCDSARQTCCPRPAGKSATLHCGRTSHALALERLIRSMAGKRVRVQDMIAAAKEPKTPLHSSWTWARLAMALFSAHCHLQNDPITFDGDNSQIFVDDCNTYLIVYKTGVFTVTSVQVSVTEPCMHPTGILDTVND